jgi:glutathione S-transferase
MALTLHYHPLSSFCWKVLIGLYENGTPFERVVVNLGDPASRAAFYALSPAGKMPVLRDEARDETVPETTIILDYLDVHHPGPVRFVPGDADEGRRARLWDRFVDLYVHLPMQRIVGDRLRPEGDRDPYGVAEARAQIARSCAILEEQLAGRTWLTGEDFGLADCAAAPPLFYAVKVGALGPDHPEVMAYLERLKARPSFARVLAEAEPYFHMFPA